MAESWTNLGNANSSAFQLVAITPSDTTDLTPLGIRCIRVGGAGDVAVIAMGDSAPQTFVACAIGERLQVFVSKVKATGTTATSLIGMI